MNRRALLASALGAGLGACSRKTPPSASVFDDLLASVTADVFAESPEFALRAGLTPKQAGLDTLGLLDDRSAERVDLRRAAALRRFTQWRGLDRALLSAAEAVTYDTLGAYFGALAGGARFPYGQFSVANGFSPYVFNQYDSAILTLGGVLDLDRAPASLDEAERDLARLRAIPAALDAESARARADAQAGVTPPDFVLDRVLQRAAALAEAPPEQSRAVLAFRKRLEAIAGPLGDEQNASPAAKRARAMFAAAVAIAGERIAPAHRRTIATLLSLRERATPEAGIWRLPEGRAYYRAALQHQTSTSLTPEAIHAAGLARVRAVSAQLDMMLRSQGLAEGSTGQRLALLSADPRFRYPDDPVGRGLADLQTYQKRAAAQLPRWFAGPPPAPLQINPAADALAPSVAYQPPSLDNRRPGFFCFNARAMATWARFDLATLSHHEGLPGHHLQSIAAQSRTELPLLRRVLSFNLYSEGWATYGEQLADEMGLFEGDPFSRIGYLRWQVWRAARLVVDTGMHAMQWSREAAAQYLLSATGDNPATIDSEIARYAVAPGQACGYELGRREIVRLRDRARAAIGARFDIREFHAVILGHGEAPPAVLEALVDAWTAPGRKPSQG